MPSAQSDRTIFEDLSFDVDRGQIVDLAGPSGSGKSSLLTAFALLNPHADGTFTLDGADSSSFSLQQWRRNVAYLPQKPMLMGDSVADTIRLPWTLAVRRADEASAPDDHAATGKKTSARRGRFSRLFRSEQSQAKLALPDQLIRNTLDAMGCEDIDLARAPHDLSGGQAARVSLARTLLTRPAVLLADEVDAGLDDDNADKVASIMASAAAGGHGHRAHTAPSARRPSHTHRHTVLGEAVMSGNGYVIDNWGLLVALLMVAVAALVSELMCISIGKTLMWSAIRALVQLCVMGVIIGYVIRSNNPWLVFGVIAVMLVAAVQITLSRAKGIPKGLAGPVLLSLVITMLLMISLVTELVVRPHPWYAPQLVVPLTGMLLGNTVSALAVGLSRFYESMNERRDEVDTLLALGATPWEAARPSIVSSIRLGLLPTTASLASCGIVTIPGMMAGQVIAGGDPLNAAKYQFVVLAAIAALTLVADALIMTMTYRTCFTDKDQYKPPEDR